jgi:hypothetical protein
VALPGPAPSRRQFPAQPQVSIDIVRSCRRSINRGLFARIMPGTYGQDKTCRKGPQLRHVFRNCPGALFAATIMACRAATGCVALHGRQKLTGQNSLPFRRNVLADGAGRHQRQVEDENRTQQSSVRRKAGLTS